MTFSRIHPSAFAILATAFDALWAAQAMAVTRVHAVSNVELLSLIVWCFAHLPAALLASAVLKPLGWLPSPPETMPDAALGVLVGLGLLQTFGLAWAIGAWAQRRARAGQP
jgi:hypothetical protein